MSKEGGNRYSLCAWGWMVPNTQRRMAAMTLHTGCGGEQCFEGHREIPQASRGRKPHGQIDKAMDVNQTAG